MDELKAKQQIVEKIKESTNILVTVSNNPTVDALSAAIGLTLLIDKLDKHATAIFSGVVPPAIAFLEPEKILDDTTDSLRDFIIALDKEKADHLRYKLEGDAVKIFITPYKTTITADDLEFSQGDYNVELVIALGVDDQAHLDKALEAHGQILHDATVITITAGDDTSNLGGIDWHDDNVSSLSEMLAGLSEALKPEKKKSLMDAQIATAFLTGIVAQTERFSNRNTTSKVMTVASQLMAAGADQQLIATKLENYQSIPEIEDNAPAAISDDGVLKINNEEEVAEEEAPEPPKDSISIEHKPFETLEEMDKRVKAAEQAEAAAVAEAALDQAESAPTPEPAPAPTVNSYADDEWRKEAVLPAPATLPTPTPLPQPEQLNPVVTPVTSQMDEVQEPSFGGTLNATTDQAAEDSRRAELDDQNKTILHHSYLEQPTEPQTSEGGPVEDTAAHGEAYILNPQGVPNIAPPAPEPASPLNPAVAPQPPSPVDLGLPMPPPLPEASVPTPEPALSVPPMLSGPYAPEPSAESLVPPAPSAQPERLGDILASDDPAPTIDSPFANPVPPIQPTGPYAMPDVPPAPAPAPAPAPSPTPAPGPGDPAQFKIPGQQ